MLTKIIDKLLDPFENLVLKKFNINSSVFFSYVFGLLTAFFTLDRFAEIIHILLTGQGVHYWGPFMYAFAIACVILGYSILCGSPLSTTTRHNYKFFKYYLPCFYIIVFSMATQWLNSVTWLVLMQLDKFDYILANLPEIITPAVKAISLMFPAMSITFFGSYVIDHIVDDDIDFVDSFEDFSGLKLEVSKKNTLAPFMCDITLCMDEKTGKPAVTPEKKRFEATLIQGATGTGKTATMVEPMCAMDIERKYFFREVSKKLGYNVLQAGLATLHVPYSNEFLNKNFTLSFLTPRENKIEEYKEYVSDMVKYVDPETKDFYYRGIGITLVAPDTGCIDRVQKVAAAYEIPVNIIDPMNPNSLGINPFIGDDPAKVASIISTVLKGMNESEGTTGDQFFTSVSQQAFENLAILLKLIYPRMNHGDMPTLEDMLRILNNFDLAEEMCEVLKKDPVLAEEYKSLVGYFEKNFYKPPVNIHGYEIETTYGSGRKETEKFVYGAITQLDNFLRNPGVKRVLCSRHNNIDLDRVLADGQVVTACTRQGDLGEIHQKAFGMFVILSIKDAVLRRPGVEDSRTPHFLYIDEFPLFVNKDTEAFFTLFRKYRCGTIITIQNLSQLTKNKSLAYFKEVILTNTKTQILFGDMVYEEAEYWANEIGTKKKWKHSNITDDTATDEGNAKLVNNLANASEDTVQKYKPNKIATLAFKKCIYKTKDEKSKDVTGIGKTSFIDEKYYQPHPCLEYDFERFINNTSSSNNFFSEGDTEKYAAPTENIRTVTTEKINPIHSNTIASELVIEPDLHIDLDNNGENDFPIILPHMANPDSSLKDYMKQQEAKAAEISPSSTNVVADEIDLSSLNEDSIVIDLNQNNPK